eukprot:scaffold253416_cov32-Tisochrysis_lutea.AAC.3
MSTSCGSRPANVVLATMPRPLASSQAVRARVLSANASSTSNSWSASTRSSTTNSLSTANVPCAAFAFPSSSVEASPHLTLQPSTTSVADLPMGTAPDMTRPIKTSLSPQARIAECDEELARSGDEVNA